MVKNRLKKKKKHTKIFAFGYWASFHFIKTAVFDRKIRTSFKKRAVSHSMRSAGATRLLSWLIINSDKLKNKMKAMITFEVGSALMLKFWDLSFQAEWIYN